jgi:hypothetical protein
VGAIIAVLGWLWVLHLVVLVGFAATNRWVAIGAALSNPPAPEPGPPSRPGA